MFENEFSLVSCLFGIGVKSALLEDSDAWVVDSGASSHKKRIQNVFRSISETDSDCHVAYGFDTIHVVMVVKTLKF